MSVPLCAICCAVSRSITHLLTLSAEASLIVTIVVYLISLVSAPSPVNKESINHLQKPLI